EVAGNKKSTSHIDDIIKLTAKGHEYVQEIQTGVKKDKLCWSWIMFCSGDGNKYQHKFRVHSFSRLSYLNSSYPLRIKIEGTHLPSNLINTANVPKISRINLTREVKDKIIISRHADHRTIKGIKGKLLVSLNGTSEEELNNALSNNREICSNTKLKWFITHEDRRLKENLQPDLSKPEDSPDHYYQLTVSDEFWLRNGRKFGQLYFRIDRKYDLNIDRAPVLTMVVENNTGHGTSLAFRVEGIVCGTILCWFYIMQTFGENLKIWNIPHSFRLRMQFIDAGRLSISSNLQKPITTNNYTERMNRTIESQLSGKQTVVTFIEQLYGIKLLRENLNPEGTNKNVYEAGLVTLLNAQSVEQQNELFKIISTMNRRLNRGRLCFLMGLVKPSSHPNYYYVKKTYESNIVIDSFDTDEFTELEEPIDHFKLMMNQLVKNCEVELRDRFYVTNIVTGECPLCLDYIWNGPFYDVCKHCHAARIFSQGNNLNNIQETKEKLVNYFKNKERAILADQKNNLIYHRSTEVAYQEIARLFNSE
ncbi:6161_t:CDS:2, partial [Scutellospora calospora]